MIIITLQLTKYQQKLQFISLKLSNKKKKKKPIQLI